MTIPGATVSDVVAAFKLRGFRYICRTSTSQIKFTGPLIVDDCSYECQVYVSPDFASPPLIYLEEIPPELKPIAPHISPAGNICYLAKSTITLDIFDPVGQMLACLDRCQHVLGQILRGEVTGDLAGEFFAYWGGNDFFCYYDVAAPNLSKVTCMVNWDDENDAAPVLFLTDDKARTTYKAAGLGCRVVGLDIAVATVSTKTCPKPSLKHWPITNVGGLLDWQAALDKTTSREIRSMLLGMLRQKYGIGVVIVESPFYFYSFLVFFNNVTNRNLKLSTGDSFYEKAVVPLVGYRLDQRYITQRNIPGMKTLVGKKIALVGCGTIGGYIADLLVKAGAGADKGRLTLIDPDILNSQNLGRHLLGFKYLAKRKATALAHHLVVNMPDTSAIGLVRDVREVNLREMDLIIDATADGAVSSYLAKTYGVPAILTIWIEGPGVAIGGFLKPAAGHACAHCLATHNKAGKYLTTTEPIPPKFEGQGCEQEYVAFPATVSMRAACLAVEMVMEWVNGVAASVLRTEVLDPKFTSANCVATPNKIEACPACST